MADSCWSLLLTLFLFPFPGQYFQIEVQLSNKFIITTNNQTTDQ